MRPCRTHLKKQLLQTIATGIRTLRSLFRRNQHASLQDTAHKTSPSKNSNYYFVDIRTQLIKQLLQNIATLASGPFVLCFVDISMRPCRIQLINLQNIATGIRKEPFVLYFVESVCVPVENISKNSGAGPLTVFCKSIR
jgi:hypothetical protein